MYFVYLIKSLSFDKFYIGYTSNIKERIERHNQGREKYTKKYLPWKLVYANEFETRSEAIRYEKYLKSLKSKKFLEELEKRWRGCSSTG